jgi:large subunit ribosomal protein L18
MKNKQNKRKRLKAKIRVKIRGVSERPRFSVFRSNKFIYAQLIDDIRGMTLVEASDVKLVTGSKTQRAKQVGSQIAKKALVKNITQVVFDRNGFKYTGRVKLVADEARVSGLKF